MARYGVLGDIHANREALVASLNRLDGFIVDQVLCLGDIVGYNADPDDCVALVQRRRAVAIAGNHDLIGIGRLGFERCATKVEYSLKRTRQALSHGTIQYLAALPARREIGDGIVMIHGGVRQVDQYIASPALIAQNAAELAEDFPEARYCLFGHTHSPKVYEVDGDRVEELEAVGRVQLRPDRRYFINPGSVDPSRKRDSKLAEFAVLDTGTHTVEFLSVLYDHRAAEDRAAREGYRIGPWMDRLYTLRRRVQGRMSRMV